MVNIAIVLSHCVFKELHNIQENKLGNFFCVKAMSTSAVSTQYVLLENMISFLRVLKQGLVCLNRNGNSTTFSSYVCNAKKI